MFTYLKTKQVTSVGFMVVFCLCSLAFFGCASMDGYLGFWGRQKVLKKKFHEEPSADLLRQLEPEGCFLLAGQFAYPTDYKKPLLVIVATDRFRSREIVAAKILPSSALYYSVYLPEGLYDLYFFADLDGNGYFDAHEMVGQTSEAQVPVNTSESRDDLLVNGPSFTLDLIHPKKTDLPVKVKVRGGGGAVYDSLGNDFFDPRYGSVGLYDPKSFMAHTQRYVFGLEEFNPGKTIVFFVHGVQGTPRDFSYFVDGLDRSRYQPWFFFYPTGMPLQKLGSLMADILVAANASGHYPLKSVIVVAHSMGGLVALSAINQLCRDGVPPYLKGYVSVDTPYGGVSSAQKGVETAPAVVPSWRDVATGSPFLEKLYKDTGGLNIPFYLFFGYGSKASSDGTISLQSQLEPSVHFRALKSYGFNASHVGIINDKAAREKFYEVLGALDDSKK